VASYVILQLRKNGYRWYAGRGYVTGIGYTNHHWTLTLNIAARYDKHAASLAALSIKGKTSVHSVSRAKEIDRSLRAVWNIKPTRNPK
jgi:hypothetical protein